MTPFFDAVYEAVRAVPRGRVCTYGQVALMVGSPGAARQVGWALHCLPAGTEVPWHRVVNARGGISKRSRWGEAERQRVLLESEEVEFDENGLIDLYRYGYTPE